MNHLTSADYHLGHGKIIEYCNRPFSTSFQMNEAIIARHNERVKPDDMFYFLGDFCYKAGLNCDKAEDWLARLNGNKIMIRGNHDNNNSCKTIIDCMHITFANRRINMVHKPTHANPNFEINLCGHVHDKWRIQTYAQQYQKLSDIVSGKYGVEKEYPEFIKFLDEQRNNRNSDSVLLNVGIDVQRYMPITLDEAIGQVIRFRKGIAEKGD